MRNLTKESRQTSRSYQFNALIEQGYLQETYKEIDFFTKEDQYFTLKVFRGTGANHVEYINYRTAARRSEVIQNYKSNYDRRLTYKAEQKVINKGKSSNHAGAAAAIKAELKTLYPLVKFSATSDSFSMGDSVHVSWTDGPTDSEVDNIIKKYQYGSFNSMEDLYESSNSRNDIPQSKYVSGSRTQSEELKALLPQLEELLKDYHSDDYDNSTERVFYRLCSKTSFPANYTEAKIIKTDCRCGSMEDFYKIVFNTQETDQQTTAEPIEQTAGSINIVDYSEKAFAIIGAAEDLKAIQIKMYDLGGKYNKYLKCGPGYIFSKKKLEEVTAALSEPQKAEPLQLAAPQTIETDDRQHEAAAKSGKVISLFNLSQLVNSK